MNAPVRISADQADFDQPWTIGAPNAYQLLVDLIDPFHMGDEEQQAIVTLLLYLKRREHAYRISAEPIAADAVVIPLKVAPPEVPPTSPDDGVPESDRPQGRELGGKAEDGSSGAGEAVLGLESAGGTGADHGPRESSEVAPEPGPDQGGDTPLASALEPLPKAARRPDAVKVDPLPRLNPIPAGCVAWVDVPNKRLFGPRGSMKVRDGLLRMLPKLSTGVLCQLSDLRNLAPANFGSPEAVRLHLRHATPIFDALGLEIRERPGTELVRLTRWDDQGA